MENRESYLNKLLDKCSIFFNEQGYEVPKNIRVTCGWCSTGNESQKRASRIGECWSPKASDDSTIEIIISMKISDPVEVAEVLIHEMVHAVVGVDKGHGPVFRECALAIGLQGQMRTTKLGPILWNRVGHLLDGLGDYPHATLNMYDRKKQSTRMIKVQCTDCNYTVRVSRKWLDVGSPICPSHSIPMETI